MLEVKIKTYRFLCKNEDDYKKYAIKLKQEYPNKISFYVAYKRLKNDI